MWVFWRDFRNVPNIKFHRNLLIGSSVDTRKDGGTDGQTGRRTDGTKVRGALASMRKRHVS
jgi:hypothetical protein